MQSVPTITAPRNSAAWLLALAMVYQSGVGACGCLEHNGWLHLLGMFRDAQGAEGICVHAESAGDDVHKGDAGQPTGGHNVNMDHHDCDGARIAAILNSRGAGSRSPVVREAADSGFTVVPLLSASLDQCGEALCVAANCQLAAPPRAQIQVFLL